MRYLLLLLTLLYSSCADAQVKVQDLTEDVSPSGTNDIGYSIKNYATAPVQRSVKWGNITKLSGWQRSGTTVSLANSTDNVVIPGTITAGTFIGDGSGLSGVSGGGGGGGGTGNVGIGTTGWIPYYNANGSSVVASSNIRLVGSNVGIGSTAPGKTVDVTGTGRFSSTLTASNLSGTNTGDQTIVLTGDVTGSGTGSFAATIGAGKVTNADLAGSITAAKLVGTDITTVGTVTSGNWNGTAIPYNFGGTGLSAAADDNIMIGSGLGWQSKPLSDCQDSSGNHLNYNATTNSFSCGSSSGSTVSAAGSTTQLQYNNGGSFGGAAALTYDSAINASSGVETPLAISPTISQSGTAGYDALQINATESATGSGAKNLLNLKLAGTSKANIDDTGAVTATSYTTNSTSAGAIQLNEASANGTNFIKLTSAASRSADATITIDGTDATTITLPTTTQTLVGKTSTDTLTNKWIQPRSNTTASSATPSINTDTTDIFTITALAAAITSMSTNLTGTPTNGQKLIIRIKDNGTARAITWGASFAARGASLPSTTTVNKVSYIGLIWNSTASSWDCVASLTEA